MAKNMQPIAKRCKALGISPAVMGYAKKETKRNPGGQMRKKKSEYAIQLNEKQKVKFVYGILEKQFRMYYEKASAMSGKTGENLLSLVERRLDNVVYRLGFAMGVSIHSIWGFSISIMQYPPSFQPGARGRCDRGQGEQPLLRRLQALHSRGCSSGHRSHLAGA